MLLWKFRKTHPSVSDDGRVYDWGWVDCPWFYQPVSHNHKPDWQAESGSSPGIPGRGGSGPFAPGRKWQSILLQLTVSDGVLVVFD